jgi:methionyl-tRNA formyltransferase
MGNAVRLRRYRPSIGFGNVPESIEHTAGEHGVPLYEVRRPLGAQLRSVLEQHQPDLLVTACFPWRIPARIREVAHLGGANLHPSPLPQFRGPDPLFWAYRSGCRNWGTTVHVLGDAFDAGAILAQSGLLIPDEMPGDELERQAALLGSDLLLEVISRAGGEALHGSSQNETEASYQTWPNADQLIVDHSWTVQHVINFVIGVRPLGYEPLVDTASGMRVVESARLADREASGGEAWLDEQTVRMSFADGVIEFSVA